MTGVSRICLNKNVKEQFGTTVSDMIRSRMVEEIKSRLLFSGLSVKEVAFSLHFSEPNHMMRFFKSQTGQTVCEFVSGYQMVVFRKSMVVPFCLKCINFAAKFKV